MSKLLKDSVKTTNDNIILAIPLVVFMWIVGLYLGYSRLSADSIPEFALAIVTLLFMLGAFLSGWFYMVRAAVQVSKKVYVLDEDRAKATMGLFKEFPAGIGHYFLSFIGMAVLFLVIFIVLGMVIYQVGTYFLGDLQLSQLQIKQILGSPEDMKLFVDSLSENQLIQLFYWNLLFMIGSAVVSYLTILWVPEVVNGVRNPLVALFRSIKKVLKYPVSSFKLFLFIGVTNFLVSFISTFAMYNPLTYLLMMIIYFYYLVYIIVLLFTYYDRKFVEANAEGLLEETTSQKNEENDEAEK